jgi:hypothetical protein
MIDWFVQTLRSYPEIAIFLSLALGITSAPSPTKVWVWER